MTNKPVELCQAAAGAGVYKSGLSVGNLLLRGFMAGLYIAVGAALATMCATGVSDWAGPGMSKLILGAVFPVGLICIVLTGMELFTGDCMLVPMAAMQKKTTWGKVLNVWVWVYIGNFIGSLFWAHLMAVGPLVGPTGTANAFGATAMAISLGKVGYSAGGMFGMYSAFMKAIGCNLLVNVAILLALSSKAMIGKFFGVWFPIMAFVSSGFEHCVANMYFIPAGMMLGNGVTVSQFIIWNLIPVTLGNIVGGFVFIGAVYHMAFKGEFPAE